MPYILLSLIFLLVATGCSHTLPQTKQNINAVYPEQSESIDLSQLSQENIVKPISSDDLIGDWNVEGNTDIQISIRADGTFSSFLNQRPMTEGTWTFVVGTLILNSDAFGKEIYVGATRNGEKIMFQTDGGEEVWTRI
ncbi:MAG: hypothetical protein HYV41_03790 [Candidatus Magasanikbacteria bacterium]|nr:hypothetical protein [Candidatus Magasanikbacteria bacterium]